MRISLKLAAASILAFGIAGAAFADPVTKTYEAFVPMQTVAYNKQIELTKFDTTLGTLTGVSLSLETEILATVTVENPTNMTKRYRSIEGSVPISIFGPGNTAISTTALARRTFGTGKTITAGQIITESGLSSTSFDQIAVPLEAWGQYQGFGTQSLFLNAIAEDAAVLGRGDAGVQYSANGQASARVRVTYQYNAAPASAPVPEPGTLGLLAGVLAPAAVGMVRRRRK